MRIVCFVVAALAMFVSLVFAVMAVVGVRGILGVAVDEASHTDLAGVFALFGVAWMVGAVAFRPAPRDVGPRALHDA